jgi:prepilin-type N-terminal cleavage/methylation domain-containing protein
MFIDVSPKTRRGWTLPEMMVAVGIFSICGAALMGMYLFCVKGMASMYNYSLLDQYNRQAMDQVTREIRQAKDVITYRTNSITIQSANSDGSNGPQVTYSFNGTSQKLIRTADDGSSQVLLNNCSLLQFQLFTRCPTNDILDSITNEFPIATSNWTNTVKVLRLTWKTAIQLPSGPINSENIQTAQVVIRKQQDS